MIISYNWLTEFLEQGDMPVPDPGSLSKLLTDIGLEVESLEKYEQVPGGLEGLVIGKVIEVKAHSNADRLKITHVDVGAESPLKIVCGAPNVAEGQRVVVAPVGVTIFPVNGEPVTMKKASIRGEESFGMICAEDEIGLGESHQGIMTLPDDARPGMKAKAYFQPAEDWIYEIGLTPNRMDAMSHLGVARDVCARLSYTSKKQWHVRPVAVDAFKAEENSQPISVTIENEKACPRYAGVTLSDIRVAPSPKWLQQRLKAIGVRPINNVVDVTNYVLHECGQPLHAFDVKAIKGQQIKVKNLPEGTPFVTLDKETRKLNAADLMICNESEGMCIAGVFGGLDSGVTEKTTAIFLESAYFDPVTIRRTSFRHGLRTDAATHFEKGVAVSGVIYALKRAALLMKALCGARIVSEIVDVYPVPKKKTKITLKLDYLVKLSGKAYTATQAASILGNLGFDVVTQSEEALTVAAPYTKPDMDVAADLVEEIMRIDGYDNIAIPGHIRIAPSSGENADNERQKEKITAYLSDNGFHEIMTNSITNGKYYDDKQPLVGLMNNLSSELDVLRPSLLETGLETVAYNLNRKQENILFFELGTVYAKEGMQERPMLSLLASGNKLPENWVADALPVDPYFLKGHLKSLCVRVGIQPAAIAFVPEEASERLQEVLSIQINNKSIGQLGRVSAKKLQQFAIKQAVWFVEIDLSLLHKTLPEKEVVFSAIPQYPEVRRDLALILDKKIKFSAVENIAKGIKTRILEQINLFDVFEGEKLEAGKKSYAVSFIFRHPEKTLTDKEIDKVMKRLMQSFETQLGATIRS